MPSWSVRQVSGQAYSCSLSVTCRAADIWVWYVMVADHRIGDGVARTMKAAQDAAVYAAKQHNFRKRNSSTGAFLARMSLALGIF